MQATTAMPKPTSDITFALCMAASNSSTSSTISYRLGTPILISAIRMSD